MSDLVNQFDAKWNELCTLVKELELDVRKSVGGNQSAGGRSRKGLRQLRKLAQEAQRLSLLCSREETTARKAS